MSIAWSFPREPCFIPLMDRPFTFFSSTNGEEKPESDEFFINLYYHVTDFAFAKGLPLVSVFKHVCFQRSTKFPNIHKPSPILVPFENKNKMFFFLEKETSSCSQTWLCDPNQFRVGHYCVLRMHKHFPMLSHKQKGAHFSQAAEQFTGAPSLLNTGLFSIKIQFCKFHHKV